MKKPDKRKIEEPAKKVTKRKSDGVEESASRKKTKNGKNINVLIFAAWTHVLCNCVLYINEILISNYQTASESIEFHIFI